MDFKDEFKKLIQIVTAEGASDMHLSEGRFPTIRTSGLLVPINRSKQLTKEDLNQILFMVLSPDKREEFLQKKELDFAFQMEGVRFRGNAFFQQGVISLAFRVINDEIKTLEELKLPPILEIFAKKKQGFFLVVGPTGHGKSTTVRNISLQSKILSKFYINKNNQLLISERLGLILMDLQSLLSQRSVKTLMFFLLERCVDPKPLRQQLLLLRLVIWYFQHFTQTTLHKQLTVSLMRSQGTNKNKSDRSYQML